MSRIFIKMYFFFVISCSNYHKQFLSVSNCHFADRNGTSDCDSDLFRYCFVYLLSACECVCVFAMLGRMIVSSSGEMLSRQCSGDKSCVSFHKFTSCSGH